MVRLAYSICASVRPLQQVEDWSSDQLEDPFHPELVEVGSSWESNYFLIMSHVSELLNLAWLP